MNREGFTGEGFKTVGQIIGSNRLLIEAALSGLEVVVELLTSHSSEAPVVDVKGHCIGFISELDVLGASESGKDLRMVRADEMMNGAPIAIHESTNIDEAIKIMKDKHILNLPVEKNGKVVYSVTRQDLLRARIRLGPDIEAVAVGSFSEDTTHGTKEASLTLTRGYEGIDVKEASELWFTVTLNHDDTEAKE
jgi:CBS domain-containing protein